jgi:lysophospholipase L1-like esterase
MTGEHARSRPALKLAAAAVVILASILMLLAAEAAVRTLSDIRFFGNSSNLLTPVTSTRYKNAPQTHAVSFGAEVFTDRDGYRIPSAEYIYPPQGKAVFILGDSVAFGPGVPEPRSFVGMLRARRPDLAIYNSAVIAYGTEDYAAVLQDELARRTPSAVYLVFCLNDVRTASAVELHKASPPATWVEALRVVSWISMLNDYLRENSKLYIYAKGVASDPARRYFQADLEPYRDVAMVRAALRPIEAIADTLKRRGIPLTVLISPYEYQLRSRDDDSLLPQQVVTRALAERGIRTIDTMEWFRADGKSSRNYFLRFDPMHLSEEGHRVMADGIAGSM